jgi:hypothetical protein
MAKKQTFSVSDMLESGCKAHQELAYTICIPILQGDTMEFQRGLPFAAISVEKSAGPFCIQGCLAAEDDDHFATAWNMGETDRRADRAGMQAAEELGDCF